MGYKPIFKGHDMVKAAEEFDICLDEAQWMKLLDTQIYKLSSQMQGNNIISGSCYVQN